MIDQEAEAALTQEVVVTAGAGVQSMLDFYSVLHSSLPMAALIVDCIVPQICFSVTVTCG